MPIGISRLARFIPTTTSSDTVRISLGHAHQLMAAALGYGTLAAYQAAQAAAAEPDALDAVRHVVLNHEAVAVRALELGIALPPARLQELVQLAFGERLPSAHVHASFGALEEFIRQHVDSEVLEAEEVVSEMASANYDGIDEIYFDYAVDPGATPIGESLHVELEGHIGLGADEDRPSMGDRVWVSGSLRFERFGQRCFGALEVLVHRARLGDRWRGLDDLDHAEDGPPLVTRTNALAELLGLEPAEVGALIDVDPEAQTGSSGEMVYGYVLDFEPLASPEVAARIRARHGSLQVEVGPGYFDNVVDDDWPA